MCNWNHSTKQGKYLFARDSLLCMNKKPFLFQCKTFYYLNEDALNMIENFVYTFYFLHLLIVR